MKRFFLLLIICIFFLPACSRQAAPAHIAATTLPVYEFTARLCEGTDITVTRLVTENVSCLHDYSLNVRQVKAAEAAELVILSGAGLEDFMTDILADKPTVDSSAGIDLLECVSDHEHDHDHGHDHAHHHETDSHIWLSPENAKIMAQNIFHGLCAQYPRHTDTFQQNLSDLLTDLDTLQTYGEDTLAGLECRDLITFHDGFGYFADAFDLHILQAVEEESGREASAQELKQLIHIVREHDLPAVFTEVNGSVSAAEVICRETGASLYTLDMAMGSSSYFDAMYHNINTLKEALE